MPREKRLQQTVRALPLGILSELPSAEELAARAQELRDELARVEALQECVERMRGAAAQPSDEAYFSRAAELE